ncbi:MAG TPA: hypothetical protein VFS10_16040, partial [Pyrinomonadaceae bacterium]|nr:hypothetical protein [Pyrinomonadaceae bacterium]
MKTTNFVQASDEADEVARPADGRQRALDIRRGPAPGVAPDGEPLVLRAGDRLDGDDVTRQANRMNLTPAERRRVLSRARLSARSASRRSPIFVLTSKGARNIFAGNTGRVRFDESLTLVSHDIQTQRA